MKNTLLNNKYKILTMFNVIIQLFLGPLPGHVADLLPAVGYFTLSAQLVELTA